MDATYRVITTDKAIRLAELSSIKDDLRHVKKCCGLFEHKFGDDTRREALFDSIAIRYRRCFTNNGIRRPLVVSDLTCLSHPLARLARKRHQFVIDVANMHIAHSVNSFEVYAIPLAVWKKEDGSLQRGGVIPQNHVIMSWGDLNVKKFGEDVGYMLQELTQKFFPLREEVEKEIEQMTDDEILAQPDGTYPPICGEKVKAAREWPIPLGKRKKA